MKNKLLVLVTVSFISIMLILFFDLNFEILHYALSKRIIKVLAIIITSIAIGTSTVLFQTITTNRILTPSIFGLDTLYLLIQAVVIFTVSPVSFFIQNSYVNFIANFILLTLFGLAMFLILFKRFNGLYQLLLSGIIFSTLFQSLLSVIQMLMDPASFDFFQSFMFASFNNLNDEIIYFLLIIVLVLFAIIYREDKELDILSLGKDASLNLGVMYDKKILLYLILILILTAISTALVGPITFLGFLAVNLGITFMNTYRHQYLLPAVICISIIILSIGHLLTEEIFGVGVPISIVINFIGGLYFIRLLLKENVA